MNLQKKGRYTVQIVLAFLGTYGICYLCKIAGIQQAHFSVMSVMIAVIVYMLLDKARTNLEAVTDKKQLKKRVGYAFFVSFLFALSMIMGYQLQNYGMTDCGVLGKGLLVLRALCLEIAVFPFGNMLFYGLERIGVKSEPVQEKKPWKPGAVFGISAAVIFVCLIPVWLAYYPAIMSYDFHRQINEAAKGFAWFWPFQPIAHTWIIWVFLQLGYALEDLEAGMAGLSLLHMSVYSLVSAYGTAFIYRLTKKKWAVVAAVLFLSLFPLNTVLVLCTTKDVLFSILFVLFVLLLTERFFFAAGRKKLLIDILLVLEGCIMVQFRNNALYAVLVFCVLWFLFAARKEKLRVLLLCVLLVAGGKGTSVVIKEAIGTEMTLSKVEMYSVPIQQFSRVAYYHGHELEGEYFELLESYYPYDAWSGYDPTIADGAKASVGATTFSEAWEGNGVQLVRDWMKLGLKYPNEYIDAFLELTRGYWFLDDRSNSECLGYGVETRMGVLHTHHSAEIEDVGEIKHESKFPWLEEQLEKIVSGNAYYNWPVVSILFRCAFYFWGLCLVLVAYFFKGQKKQAVLCLFPLLYMGTMLLGPVVQIRYVFPIMLSLPVLIALLFWGKRDAAEEQSEEKQEIIRENVKK